QLHTSLVSYRAARPARPTAFPYTTLFRSSARDFMSAMKPGRPPDRPRMALLVETSLASGRDILKGIARYVREQGPWSLYHEPRRSEEHTSELQSLRHLVCRLLLDKTNAHV